MADLAPAANRPVAQPNEERQKQDSGSPISTHVLVPQEQLIRLRELSRRTRVAQSEYLREAVDDLLTKSGLQSASIKRGRPMEIRCPRDPRPRGLSNRRAPGKRPTPWKSTSRIPSRTRAPVPALVPAALPE